MPDLNLTPAAWLALLERKLDEQSAAVKQPIDYYNGVQKLSFATAKFKEAFSRYFPPMANNWMKLVVDTPASRLTVQGFRFDPATTSAAQWDEEADGDAWRIWQANNLDAGSAMAHVEAIKCGVANALVTPRGGGLEPLITIEHASESFVYCSPTNRMLRLAAIKRWLAEDGYAYATVWLPDRVIGWRSADRLPSGDISRVQWTSRTDVPPLQRNAAGVVPMVPIENNPDLIHGGRSDLETAMPIQDAINKLCLDMQVSSEFHAFPQRWATGWEKSIGPDGKELGTSQEDLAVGQTRFLRGVSPETKFGQLEPGEVGNYIQPIEMYVDHLAAVTQTPAYYLKGKMANLSAEALRAADAGLNDRVGRKQLNFGDSWEEVMRVAFLAKGDTKRGKATTAETLWKPAEVQGIAALVDAAVKMRAELSVPLEMCWELLGFSPQKIRQIKAMMNLPASPAQATNADSPAIPDQRGLPTGGTPSGDAVPTTS